jgi:hypothetical protein
MKLVFDIVPDEEITPMLWRVRRGLLPGGKQRLNARMGARVVDTIREHLLRVSPQKHETAQRLGARPTGHLTRGLQGVRPALLQEDVEVQIPIPGIRRAFEDLTIVPRRSKYLTLPARAESYGQRARAFDDLKFIPLKGGKVPVLAKVEVSEEAGKRPGTTRKVRELVVFYWLKKEVTIRQDRDLLPSDGAFLDACEAGAEDFLEVELFNRAV